MAYNEKHLVKLADLKALGTKQKEVADALAERIDTLEGVGSQANVIETIKVNGTAQAIKDKAVDITVPTKTSQLENDKKFQTDTEVSSAIQTAISKSGHASYQKVSAVPAVDAAQENILYLVMNTTTKHYDIYAKIKGDGDTYTMEQLDDTTVDLSGYVEKEDGKGLSDENFTAALKDKLNGIEAGANKYVHPTHTAAASGLYKTTVDEEGHVTNTIPVTKDDITGLGIPAQDTTYDEATTAKAGLMSDADKTKLDGMDTTIDKAIANHTATDAEVSEMLAEIYGE